MSPNASRTDPWISVRRELQHRRSRLIRSVRADSRLADSASATLGETEHLVVYEQRQLEATLDAMQRRELERIEAALERIADDTYGRCVVCGERIHPDRLEAVPTAVVCVSCPPPGE